MESHQSRQADDGDTFVSGKIQATYFNKTDASPKAENFRVLLELTGEEAGEERPGLDLIMVLDVSRSMKTHDRLSYLKTASIFVIKKLGSADRLGVVKFSHAATEVCSLRPMRTADDKSDAEDKINALKLENGTNITDGLQMAVDMLNKREDSNNRETAILLMSDGDPNPSKYDGRQVNIQDVPVYTFGLGQDYRREVLGDLAKRSKNGVFSPVDVNNPEASSLNEAFSQILAGLLNVVVQDLTLTIKKEDSEKILKVNAGKYTENNMDIENIAKISFGNLYSRETRNILVDILLPEVELDVGDTIGQNVLSFNFSYKDPISGNVRDFNSVIVNVTRTEDPTSEESPEVLMEAARQESVEKMEKAKKKADGKKFDEAKEEIKEAKQEIERKGLDKTHPKIKGLLSELDYIINLLDPDLYEKLGRPFITSALLSHALQRFAARGKVNELRLFATPAMEKFLVQLDNYIKSGGPVPTAEEDVTFNNQQREDQMARLANQEIQNKHPLVAIAKDLAIHIGNALESLKAMQDLFNNYANNS